MLETLSLGRGSQAERAGLTGRVWDLESQGLGGKGTETEGTGGSMLGWLVPGLHLTKPRSWCGVPSSGLAAVQQQGLSCWSPRAGDLHRDRNWRRGTRKGKK